VVAHVAFGRLLQRLEIPRVIRAVAQRLIDDQAAGLAGADIGIKTVKVPQGAGFVLQVCKGCGMLP
jgi:hypothetical protein